jgi:hypothetical protein
MISNNPLHSTQRPANRRRGAALLWALVAVVIISSFAFGITTYATSHVSLAKGQANAEAALDLADAAIIWELNKMSRRDFDNTVVVDNFDSPYSGVLPGLAHLTAPTGGYGIVGNDPAGAVDVFVSNINSNGNWVAPNFFKITATGKIFTNAAGTNYVTRTVEARGRGVTPTDLYAAYGYHTLNLTGTSLTVLEQSADMARFVACAGTITLPPTVNTGGSVLLDQTNGVDAIWNGARPNVDWLYSKSTAIVPIVRAYADKILVQQGITGEANSIAYLSDPTHNDNDAFDNGGGVGTRATLGGAITRVTSLGTPARINASTWGANDVVVIRGRSDLWGGLPRGSNIYLEELSVPAGKTLEIQSGLEGTELHGPVRIFIGPLDSTATGQQINFTQGNLLVNRGDRDSFVIYNATNSPVQISSGMTMADQYGQQGFCGTIFSLNHQGSTMWGDVTLTGDLTILGSIMAYNLSHSGGTLTFGARLSQSFPYPQGVDATTSLGRIVLFYRLVRTPLIGYEERARLSAQSSER